MNGLSSLSETYSEYSLAPTDDLIKFWRSKVKVTADRRGGEDVDVDANQKSHLLLVVESFVLLLSEVSKGSFSEEKDKDRWGPADSRLSGKWSLDGGV